MINELLISFKSYKPEVLYENNIIMKCPKCLSNGYKKDKKKLVINLNKKVFHCWVCDFSGKVSFLYKTYGFIFNEEIYKKLKQNGNLSDVQKTSVLPKIYLSPLIMDINNEKITEIFRYLESKKITYDKVLKYNISFDYKYNIVVPSFNNEMKIDGLYIKDIANGRSKFFGNFDSIFNSYNFDTSNKTIIFVESPLDAITLDTVNTIVLHGVKNNIKIDSDIFKFLYSLNFDKIIIKYDEDVERVANEFKMFLLKYFRSEIIVESLENESILCNMR